MDPDGNLTISLIVLAVALLLKAFLMCAKTAIVLFPDARIRKLSEEGDPRAIKVAQITAHPTRFADSTLLLSHFFTVLITVLTTVSVFRGLGPALAPSLGSGTLLSLCLVLVAAVGTCFVVLVLTTYLPKNIAGKNPEGVAFSTVGFLGVILAVTAPFRALTTAVSSGLSKLLGFDPSDQVELVTEEEIRMLVDVGNEKGVIEQSQKEMINNIFEFDDTTAGEIMTHRTEISAVEDDGTLEEILRIAADEGFSRIPVYREDIDNVVGVIHVKDLLRRLSEGDWGEFHAADYLRPVFFVPESNRLRELFTQFTERKMQLAVVVDEYGGTSGIVTMEDVLESIVGNIQDEYDNEEEEFVVLEENVYSIDGGASLDDVEKTLRIELTGEDADYDTLGGLIIDLLGRIPGEDETPTVQVGRVEFTAVSIIDRRIARVRAVILPQTEE